MLFPEVFDQAKRERIKKDPYFSRFLETMNKDRDLFLSRPIEAVTFNKYKWYFTDGNRSEYENMYFARRGRLAVFATCVLLYHREEDVKQLEDAIWAVCDEFTWVLPAHIGDLGDHYGTDHIDLFAAETGFAFAEILYILEDKLDPKVVRRMKESVNSRIFDVYESKSFHWELCEMNWAAVCSGSVGAAYLYLDPKRFEKVKDRIRTSMVSFLNGYGEDGICTEGIGYWHYGFGFFMYYAQLLKEFTNGQEDLFQLPVVKKTAYFQQIAMMRKDYTISFSDGSQTGAASAAMTHKLREIFGESIKVLPEKYYGYEDHCYRFAAYLRQMFWVNPDYETSETPAAGHDFYPSAQWYIAHNDKVSLCAKSGHNDEPHSHNDVGSFLLMGDDGQVLYDFGSGEYTRQYFRPETRYGYLCNSSRGHSLPIINGTYQHEGREYAGKVLEHDEQFKIEIAGAYPEGTVSSLIRTFKLAENIFTLKDEYHFAQKGNQVIERFVTPIYPVLNQANGKVILNHFELSFDPSVCCSIGSEQLMDHMRVPQTMYFIDFKLEDPENFEIRVDIKEENSNETPEKPGMTAEDLRAMFKKGDDVRDAGLTTPENITRIDDLPYGKDPMQKLDIYYPKGTIVKLPTIVSIHGGGYVYGDKERYQYYCMSLAQRGFTVVNFSYPLAPEHRYPEHIQNINAVFAFAVKYAEKFNIDTQNMFIVGDSAGGHMNSQYSAAVSNPEYAKLLNLEIPDMKVRAIALNCGMYDNRAEQEGGVNDWYLGELKDRKSELKEELDILGHITSNYPPSFVMSAYGDFLLPAASPMAQFLTEKGVEAELHIYGSEEKPLGHVFHCNMRLKEAAQCNDDECDFFKKHIQL